MISTRYTGGFGDFPDVIHTCRAKNYSSLDRIAVKWVNLEGAENFLTPLYISTLLKTSLHCTILFLKVRL